MAKKKKVVDVESTEVDTESVALVKFDSDLTEDKATDLAVQFNEVLGDMSELLKTGAELVVQSEDDIEIMKEARTTRLALAKIRVAVDKKHKELKADALAFGRAVDSIKRTIHATIVPVEEHLQEQEEFIRILEQRRLNELTIAREEELRAFDVDCTHMEVGAMKQEAYHQFLKLSKAGYIATKQAEADDEARRIEQGRLDAIAEQERAIEADKQRKIAEKAQAEALAAKKKQEAAEKKLQAEKDKKDKAIANAKAAADKKIADAKAKSDAEAAKKQAEIDKMKKAESDRIAEQAAIKAKTDKERKEAEAKLLAQEQAKLSASDKEKLQLLEHNICSHIEIPEVTSDVAKKAIMNVRSQLNFLVKELRTAIKSM